MIMDALNIFDPAGTAITASAASTNVIDLYNVAAGISGTTWARDIGIGDDPLWVVVQVGTAFTAAGAATLQVAFQTAPDGGSGTPGTFVNLAMSDTIAKTALTAGAEVLRIAVPLGCQRFIRMNYTVATGPFTAGTIQAELVVDRQAFVAYPSGYSNTYV